MSLEKLHAEARVKWGLKVGPKSIQRDQEKVLHILIARTYHQCLADVEAGVPPEGHLVFKESHVKERLEAEQEGWNDCRHSILTHIKKLRTASPDRSDKTESV